MNKKCSLCKEYKPLSDFYKTIYATQSYCIKCCKQQKKDTRKNKDEWYTILCGEGNWMSFYFYE